MPVTNRLFLRQEGSAESEDSVLLSTEPGAGRVLMGSSNGIIPISFVASFWSTTVAANVTASATDGILGGPITKAQFIIPQGFTARLFRATLQSYGDGTDITALSAEVWINGQSLEWHGALAVVPEDATVKRAVAVPVDPPSTHGNYYEITTSADHAYFDARTTTNGSAGTLEALVRVYGYMFQEEP